MSKPQSSAGQQRDVLAILEGRPCPVCEDGELEREKYKDNAAAVCDDCGTPRAQVWQPAE